MAKVQLGNSLEVGHIPEPSQLGDFSQAMTTVGQQISGVFRFESQIASVKANSHVN
ncbi:hypothetical protein IAD21_05417 [Abditibacteriota bacterium]|nr:hypothetical protein IAD21_05417 [Abditibacteriota bacterium]